MGKFDNTINVSSEDIAERAYLDDDVQMCEVLPEIREQFEEVLKLYSDYAQAAKVDPEDLAKDLDLIERSFEFAYKAHRNQKRKTGEPYIIHPIAVARILTDIKVDSATLSAALLHDTIEDTAADWEMVSAKFGVSVANLVDGVTKLNTKLDNVVYNNKTDIQAENVRKMFLALSDDIRVIFIKLADRLHNMRTLKFQSPEKQIEKAQETLDIYVPFAGRFGIYKIKWELEDLCLRYLHPEEYFNLINLVNGDREQREGFMEQVVSEIRAKLKENGIDHFDIEGRPKHFYSIYKKMHDKGKTIDEIYDLYACRIIVDAVTECYQVLGIIHEMYQHVPGRFKDYIAMPKENKYQSIHTTVVSHTGTPFEVQIRTYQMHQTAEFGIAAHWHYKEAGTSSEFKADRYDEKLDEVRQIIESQTELSDSGEFLESLKMNIAPDEIFVYTPKHEVIKLPSGSCPIDFAYAIHTNIGNHMHGAKVNGRIVPLSYRLKNSDVVEILSSSKLVKGPSRDWIKIVRSANARSKINNWFKRETRDENIARGKLELNREIERNGFTASKLLMHKSLETILKRNNFQSLDDMYAAIGYGSISVIKVFGRLRDDYIRSCSEAERKELGYRVTADGNVAYDPKNLPIEIGKFDQSHSKTAKPASSKQVKTLDADEISKLAGDPHQIEESSGVTRNTKQSEAKAKAAASKQVIVDGLDTIATHMARCCCPVYGDDIVGYVTQESGVGIHKVTCANIRHIIANKDKSRKDLERYSRLVKAHWTEKSQYSSFLVKITVMANNYDRLFLDVLDKITQEKCKVENLNAVSEGPAAKLYITLKVSGKEQLDRVVEKIKTLKDVDNIVRG
ncbi:MAG: bifunctional (p)ppGpp synthetase/guanosine-3',5'-bis(diphosphate) 3'-pyrophosphohydrolase [Saccharofermentans sp.]|nr:bifunctional (p)ppGpp synthetase/guanosine-3',5'-bis(diphosphate) 3'-pyrophosphohydrolase [Saccharofermentans sp.]